MLLIRPPTDDHVSLNLLNINELQRFSHNSDNLCHLSSCVHVAACTHHTAHMLHRHAWVGCLDTVCRMCHRLYVSSRLHSLSLSLSESHYLSPATCFLINNSSLDVDSPLPPQENKRPSTGQTKRVGEEKMARRGGREVDR